MPKNDEQQPEMVARMVLVRELSSTVEDIRRLQARASELSESLHNAFPKGRYELDGIVFDSVLGKDGVTRIANIGYPTRIG